MNDQTDQTVDVSWWSACWSEEQNAKAAVFFIVIRGWGLCGSQGYFGLLSAGLWSAVPPKLSTCTIRGDSIQLVWGQRLGATSPWESTERSTKRPRRNTGPCVAVGWTQNMLLHVLLTVPVGLNVAHSCSLHVSRSAINFHRIFIFIKHMHILSLSFM